MDTTCSEGPGRPTEARADGTHVHRAVRLLEESNMELRPELMTAADARALLDSYVKAQRLASFGIAALTRKLNDAAEVARVTGTSVERARATVETGAAIDGSPTLREALKQGDISLEQASEIAKVSVSAPEAARELVELAKKEPFHVLRDKAREAKLEADRHRGLAERQRRARSARSYSDELGMVHIHLALQPHVGTPVVARAEAQARRLGTAARRGISGSRAERVAPERFDHHLADAYAAMLNNTGKAGTRRAELVVLVSHEIAGRGWQDVRSGEVCKIPGVGPVAPEVARDIAKNAFLSGLFYDGKDLRHFKRWSRSIPIEVAVALRLGEPPDFDGVMCADCGNRFRTESDHVQPVAESGPTSCRNLKWRCWNCHQAKTRTERRARAEKARRTGPPEEPVTPRPAPP